LNFYKKTPEKGITFSYRIFVEPDDMASEPREKINVREYFLLILDSLVRQVPVTGSPKRSRGSSTPLHIIMPYIGEERPLASRSRGIPEKD
jgi:hypothetical protein